MKRFVEMQHNLLAIVFPVIAYTCLEQILDTPGTAVSVRGRVVDSICHQVKRRCNVAARHPDFRLKKRFPVVAEALQSKVGQ